MLLYRAHADDIVSHVGLATSDDGIHFERHPEPVLSPTEPYEEFGAEDPRVTEIDGTYYLTYTGWDRTSAQLCLATSTDLFTWTKHGPMFPDFNTFLPQGNGQDAPWSKAGGDPAGADRRPLPDVLRRGLDLLRVVRRPDPLEAVPQRRAADGPHRAGNVRRVPGRGRPAADHHQQRADPAAAQRRGEEPGRLGPLHLRAAAVRPRRPDHDPRPDEPAVAGAVDLRGHRTGWCRT